MTPLSARLQASMALAIEKGRTDLQEQCRQMLSRVRFYETQPDGMDVNAYAMLGPNGHGPAIDMLIQSVAAARTMDEARAYRAGLLHAARHPEHFPVAGMADTQPGLSAFNHKLAFGSARKVA